MEGGSIDDASDRNSSNSESGGGGDSMIVFMWVCVCASDCVNVGVCVVV